MRVDEGRNSRKLLAIKNEGTRRSGEWGEERALRRKSLLSDPGSELRLGREKGKGKV